MRIFFLTLFLSFLFLFSASAVTVAEIEGLGYTLRSPSGGAVDLAKEVELAFPDAGPLGIIKGDISIKDGNLLVKQSSSGKATFSVSSADYRFVAEGEGLVFFKEGRFVKAVVLNGVVKSAAKDGEFKVGRCYDKDCTLQLYSSGIEKLRPFIRIEGIAYLTDEGIAVSQDEVKRIMDAELFSSEILPIADVTFLRVAKLKRAKDKEVTDALQLTGAFPTKESMINHIKMTTLNPEGNAIPVQYLEPEREYYGKHFQIYQMNNNVRFHLDAKGWFSGFLSLKNEKGNDVLRVHQGDVLVATTCDGKFEACVALNRPGKSAEVVLAGASHLVKFMPETGYRLDVLYTESGAGLVQFGNDKVSAIVEHNDVRVSPKVAPWYLTKATFSTFLKGKKLVCSAETEKCYLDGKHVYGFLNRPKLPKVELSCLPVLGCTLKFNEVEIEEDLVAYNERNKLCEFKVKDDSYAVDPETGNVGFTTREASPFADRFVKMGAHLEGKELASLLDTCGVGVGLPEGEEEALAAKVGDLGKACGSEEVATPPCHPGFTGKCTGSDDRLYVFSPKTRCWIKLF